MIKDDLKCVYYTKEQIAERVEELGKQITKDYQGKEILVVGILKGAAIFTMDLVRSIELPLTLDFMSVSSYGAGTVSSGKINIRKELDTDIKGKHVLVCEDIIDSGLTMSSLLELLRQREPASLKLCAMLSKPSRRKAKVSIDYCGWEVPDEFIVGYGLDYAEKYRNLPCIGILKPEIYL